MISLAISSCNILASSVVKSRVRSVKRSKLSSQELRFLISKTTRIRHLRIQCTNSTPWEPSPVTYSAVDEFDDRLLIETPDIIKEVNSGNMVPAPVSNNKAVESANKRTDDARLLKPLMWCLGPLILLTTSVVPTLWLPISAIYVEPSIASLLSLIGLDCIFNLGATLFLLMADSCARSKDFGNIFYESKAPFTYRIWNLVASAIGFIIPSALLFGSHKGFPQPQLPCISFSVLLGPYLLLLSVQILTELLTWHWRSPVWLVTPIVYEAYRVLQLVRGLKLSAELSTPDWVLHSIRGLVCWWVLILGLQLMRVAWFAGLTAQFQQRRQQQQQSLRVDDA